MVFRIPIIDDILKGLPENARLRAQIVELRDQMTALHTKNETLQAENESLRRQLEASKASDEDLSPDLFALLNFFFDHPEQMFIEGIAGHFRVQESVANFHVDELRKRGLIRKTEDYGYKITEKGRAYIMKHRG